MIFEFGLYVFILLFLFVLNSDGLGEVDYLLELIIIVLIIVGYY